MNTEKEYRPLGWTRVDLREAEDTAELFMELQPDFIGQNEESVRRTRSALLDAYDRLEEPAEPAATGLWPLSTFRKALACATVLAVLGVALFFIFTSLYHERRDPVATLKVLRGDVKITRPGKESPVTASSGTPVLEEDRLETSREGLAIVKIDDGSAARMDGASALSLGDFAEECASMRLDRGRVYFNLKNPDRYTVLADDLAVETRGAVFDTAKLDGSVRTRVIEGNVILAIESAPCGRASGGEEAVVHSKNGERWVEVGKSDPSFLEEPWYRWNRLLDGAPDTEGREPSTGPAEETPSGKRPVTISPSGDVGTDAQEGTELPPPPDVTPGPNPTPVTPAPVTPEPQPEPTPSGAIEISLSAAYDECGKIELNWTVKGGDDYDSLAIARSMDTAGMSYPGDRKAVLARATSYYKDTDFERGHTYYYVVCALKNGEIRSRSDVRSVVVRQEEPEPTYTLAFSVGKVTGDGVRLDWTLESTGDFEGYIVYREKVGGTTRDKIVIPSSSTQMSYTDVGVEAGTSYVYQVVVYSGGEILAYSEKCLVAVPESGKTEQTPGDATGPITKDDPPTK